MTTPIELEIDVTEAAGLGTPVHTAVSVCLPEHGRLADPPVVCFAFPGGGYNRRYYTYDLVGGSPGGQARFHTDRGWIVVACDHLGFGEATIPEGNALDLDTVAAANDATVAEVMTRLEQGTLTERLAPVKGAVRLGIGQSMGGCFTIVAQGQFGTFDGIGILGYSAIHTVVPSRPGTPAAVWPWIARRSPLDNPRILNAAAIAAAEGTGLNGAEAIGAAAAAGEHPFQWAFHHEDEPADIVALEMAASAGAADRLPAWRSATVPPCGIYMVAPGAVAQEAAAITVPVLVANGERDVTPDPKAEPKAYASSADVSVFTCPRMAHMHNFAPTRTLMWRRIHAWGSGVTAMRGGDSA